MAIVLNIVHFVCRWLKRGQAVSMDQEQEDRILMGRILLTRFREAWSLMTLRKMAERDPRTY